MMRKVLSVAMALLLVCAMPLSVMAAEWDLAAGDITVAVTENTEGGSTQTVQQGSADAVKDNNPTIKSSGETSNTITVSTEGNTTANITIDNVNINAGSDSGIDVGDSNLNLTVKGDNTINSTGDNAGIHVSGGDLTINGDGELDVTNSGFGAAIGSGRLGEMSGSITIDGNANVSAKSEYGAAIGSGFGGEMTETGNISIAGSANVTATGEGGAAIGSGGAGIMNGNITIEENATVKAESKMDSAAIGSGYDEDMNGSITIQGNSQVTTTNGTYSGFTGAAIGSGGHGNMNGTIRIGSNVTLTMNGGTGIGAGSYGKLGEKAVIIDERNKAVAEASAENETARPLYRVVDKDEKDLPYTETRKEGVLTVHCDRELATFLAKTADLQTLQAQGIHTIVFETENATSTFALEDLLKEGTGTCRLTHDGKTVTFMLDDADISDILK